MSPEEKQPFARVATGIRSRKANQQRNEEVNKSNKDTEQGKNESPRGKQTRRIKKPERNGKVNFSYVPSHYSFLPFINETGITIHDKRIFIVETKRS